MENMAIPQANISAAALAGQMNQAGGLGALAGAVGGDAFAQLLQLLMQGGGEDGTQLLMGQLQEDAEEEGTTLAAQMMAQMMAMFPSLSPAELAQLQQSDQAQQLLAAGAPGQDLLAALGQTVQQQPQLGQATQQTENPFATSQGQQAQEGAGEQAIQVLQATKASGQEDGDQSLLGGQGQFRSSIMEAQKLLRTSRTAQDPSKKQEFDLEALQGDVDSGKFRATPMNTIQPQKMPSPQEILAQVKTGLTENLAKGKNEFVVKLKPDGLGEITVKLVENGNKIALSLFTANTQVAKLLSGELAGLREALKPYNTEVHEVVVQSDTSNNATDHGQFGQQFAEHQHQQFSERQNSPSFSFGEWGEEDLPVEAPPMATLASELDTYI